MCGIFVVHSKKGEKLPVSRCLGVSKELYNRGPDYLKYDFYNNKTLFILNTILSITGKTKNNREIQKSQSNRYSISFNGEIYNYKFLSKKYLQNIKNQQDLNDTQVLVNLYDVLNKQKIPNLVNGMFAYVIFDKYHNKLIVNNDVQGEKNLYYFNNENFFIVSSTINAITKFLNNCSIDKEVIKNYFKTRHYMPIRQNSIKDVITFSPGTISEYYLSKNILSTKIYENPLNWIEEKKYNQLKKFSEEEAIEYLDYHLNEEAKLMIPDTKFGCIVSGGIDSSLQSAIISKYKTPNKYFTIDHGPKDHIMNEIDNFNSYFKKKIKRIKLNQREYIKLARKCYEIISSPLFTHDLPARLKISNYFKNENCKVFFSADGCDELFGGQQIYNTVFKGNYDYKINQSPYSSTFVEKNIKDKYQNNLNKFWKKTLNRYEFIKDKKERNIQSSLFMDYFVQSVNVANRSNDLISCNNSVEPRNIFISKRIIRIILNLPLHYKLNLKEKNKIMGQKKILKKIFSKYFDKKLIFKKAGFSGFPNSLKYKNNMYPLTRDIIGINQKKLNKYKKSYYDKNNFLRDMEWKLINTENFLNAFK
ncbi:asparagine synthase-related protein [Candidatus Pelagibacter sp.]|nr:asparagine synthase-related protein [Candidatus Pelagibacter sp.]